MAITKMQQVATDGQDGQLKPDKFIIGWFITIHLLALAAPVFFLHNWGAIICAVVLYYVTGMLGITLGYHRLLTHRSFKAPKWVERFLATCGVLALQRSPMEWVSHHRMHHAGSDTEKDPHNARKGFWWSHIGWMCYVQPQFNDETKMRRFARDIIADPYLNWLSKHWVQVGLQVALGLLLLAFGGLAYVFWGVWFRLVLVYHVTWFVNSATHKWGYTNYDSGDLSRNTWWVGIISFGEGWHNNHHTHESIAPAGHQWWELDQTWGIIKLMKKLGWATDIKMPPFYTSKFGAPAASFAKAKEAKEARTAAPARVAFDGPAVGPILQSIEPND